MALRDGSACFRDGYAGDDLTRAEILGAAFRCYQRKTIGETMMIDIAREANLSRATIYRYFAKREDILSEIVVKEIDRLFDALDEYAEKSPKISEFIIEIILFSKDFLCRSDIFRFFLDEQGVVLSHLYLNKKRISPAFNQLFLERFLAAKREEELSEELNFNEFSRWIFHAWAIHISGVPEESLSKDSLWKFLIPGILRCEPYLPVELNNRFKSF